MSSILTNNSAMTALSTLRNINDNLSQTQNRISTGLKVQSGKDNAAAFAISETMSGDSGMYKAIDEGLTLTKNAISTARLGAETISGLAQKFTERVALAQSDSVDPAKVKEELLEMVKQMDTIRQQSTFNGESLITGGGTMTVATGITRDSTANTFGTTSITVTKVDMEAEIGDLSAAGAANATFFDIATNFENTAVGAGESMAVKLEKAEELLAKTITDATSLGVAENSVENQQTFLKALSANLDAGVGSMVDANMEEEAARLQALQVQQQLASQSLSIANQAPQNILSLFR